MTLREPTASEYAILGKPSMKYNKRTGEMEDMATEKRIKLFDSLLIDISGFDEDGKPDIIEYLNEGVAEPLTNKVSNWKSYIPANWKDMACLSLNRISVDDGDTTIKN